MIGLFDTSMVNQYEAQIVTKENNTSALKGSETCSLGIKAKNQKTIKSLGTQIASINTHYDGYTIQYTGGDKCFYKSNMVDFTSEIRFVCDHIEDEGWPMLLDLELLKDRNETSAFITSPCHHVFEWRSKFACRHCLNSEVTQIAGSCIWNKRQITQLPSKECNIYPKALVEHMLMDPLLPERSRVNINDFAYERVWEESCTPIDDFLRNKTVLGVILGLFVILGLIFLCCAFTFCRFRRMQTQYY